MTPADRRDLAEDFDVVVVGYGPTGQALASLLGRAGHRVCVLERYPSLYGLPRLVNLDGEAARIVQNAGDIDQALRESTAFQMYYFLNGAGEQLLEIDWSGMHASGFPATNSMYQPYVEDAMDAGAREAGVDVRQGWEVIGLSASPRGTTVTAVAREGAPGAVAGERITIRAKYLVGADGAGSFVLESVGGEREDLGLRSAFLNIDAIRKHPLGDRFASPTVRCGPPRMNVLVPIGERRQRFEFEILPEDDWDELRRPETAWRMLRESFDVGPEDVEIYRQVIYEFDSKYTLHWRYGRILLAGDAAHLMPPFLGQGACSGLRDSVNLAWKLDLVLRGVCEEDLLEEYQRERGDHVRALIEGSVQLGLAACERDPELAAARDAAFWGPTPPPLPAPPLIDRGVLHHVDGAVARPAGDLAVQGAVTFGGRTGRFDDVLGWGFSLLGWNIDPAAELSEEQRGFLEAIRCRTVALGDGPQARVGDEQGVYRDYLQAHGFAAVIFRPDFYAFGGVASPAELPALVDELRDRLHATSARAR
jgi:3-(3-hydroxy-phenyl)propionate hydroxylase